MAKFKVTTFNAKWFSLPKINNFKKALRKEQLGLKEKEKLHRKGQRSSSKKL